MDEEGSAGAQGQLAPAGSRSLCCGPKHGSRWSNGGQDWTGKRAGGHMRRMSTGSITVPMRWARWHGWLRLAAEITLLGWFL